MGSTFWTKSFSSSVFIEEKLEEGERDLGQVRIRSKGEDDQNVSYACAKCQRINESITLKTNENVQARSRTKDFPFALEIYLHIHVNTHILLRLCAGKSQGRSNCP